MEINFELLKARIIQMKDELLNVINKKVRSYYWDLSSEVCNEIGIRKAGTPMAIMNRFEILRVSNLYFISNFFLIYRILYLT